LNQIAIDNKLDINKSDINKSDIRHKNHLSSIDLMASILQSYRRAD